MQLYIARYYSEFAQEHDFITIVASNSEKAKKAFWEDIRETYGVTPAEATQNVSLDGIWEYSQVYQVDGTAYNVKLEKVEG